MADLLRTIQQYERLLTFPDSLPAVETKRAILDGIQSLGVSQVDEVFFYYSGHGSLVDGRLIFPMSDFSADAHRQTSLENNEVDDWLKILCPKVAVKVIDCCYSGVQYVKNTEDMKAALETSFPRFNSCYFFLSSQEDEPSYADAELSYFTKEFLLEAKNRPDGPVRYRDMVDALADRFEQYQQKPQFVIQSSMKEVFFDMSEPLRRAIAGSVPNEPRQETEIQVPPPDSLVDNVQRDAAMCISKIEAEAVLRELREKIAPLSSPPELEPLYNLEIQFAGENDIDSDVASEEVIGKWIQGKAPGFFARAVFQRPRTPSAVEAAIDPYRSWNRRPYVSGFVTSSGLEYDRIIIRARPKFPNLRSWEMALVLIWSHREIAVFTYQTALVDRNWDLSDQPEEVPWRLSRFDKAKLQRVLSLADRTIEGFVKAVLSDVAAVTEGKEASA